MPTNEYMRVYMGCRYRARMDAAIAMLGGVCVMCGSSNNLELDHIDPRKKKSSISKLWSFADKVFLAEVKKCQLLCHSDHTKKTLVDSGRESARGKHGTLSSRRYCDCRECKDAVNEWSRGYYGKIPKKTALHGSSSMYNYHGCRCERCRLYNTERAREYRRNLRVRS